MDKLTLILLLSFIIFSSYMSSIVTGYGFGIVTYMRNCEAGIGVGYVTNQSNFQGVPIYSFKIPGCRR